MNLKISLTSVRTYSGSGADSHGTIYNMFAIDLDSTQEENRYGSYELNHNIFGGFSASSINKNKEFDKEVLDYMKNNKFTFDNEPGQQIRGEHVQYTPTLYEITDDRRVRKIDMPK